MFRLNWDEREDNLTELFTLVNQQNKLIDVLLDIIKVLTKQEKCKT